MTEEQIAALRAAAEKAHGWRAEYVRWDCTPITVLALLAEREALRAALKEMLREAESVDHGDDWIGRGVAAEKRDRARAALAGSAAS